MNGFDIADTR